MHRPGPVRKKAATFDEPQGRVLSRRQFCKSAVSLAATSYLGLLGREIRASKGSTPLLKPIFEKTVCPWTAENPRNDHQLIFPLSDDRLMLVWCEYYARRPSDLVRDPTTRAGAPADESACRISARLSADRGRNWGQRMILQENVGKQNVKHPNLLRLPSGEILFTFVRRDSPAERNIFLKRSVDECETWSEPVQISSPGWYCNANDHALILSSGRIILPTHGVRGGGPYRGGESKLEAFMHFSDDSGKTWKRSADSMFTSGRGCHEPSVVELSNGRLLCLLRTTLKRVFESYSDDGGDHWSEPKPTELRAPDSPPVVRRIPTTGDLLVLWNNIETERNLPRTPLTAAISRDEGKTWRLFKDIDSRPDFDSAYPSVFFCGNEVLVLHYSHNHSWARDSEVVLRIYDIDQFYE
jgi:sialidase-1